MTSTFRPYYEREIGRAAEDDQVTDFAARFGIPVQSMRDILAAQHLEALFKYLGDTETGYRTAGVQNRVTEFMAAIDRLTQGSVNTAILRRFELAGAYADLRLRLEDYFENHRFPEGIYHHDINVLPEGLEVVFYARPAVLISDDVDVIMAEVARVNDLFDVDFDIEDDGPQVVLAHQDDDPGFFGEGL